MISSGGRDLARRDLIGAVLALVQENGRVADVRIERIIDDPGRTEGDVVLYDLSVARNDGTWVPVCPAEPDGQPHAVLQPQPNGSIEILCTSGAAGKCIRLGYRPWASHNGVPLAPYWAACVHMIRADYCGDDSPTTRDGILISFHDSLGIQESAVAREAGADLPFEAAWDEEGAICVAHARVPQNVGLEALGAACPRLAGRLGATCTEEAASRLGMPLLYNASRGDGMPEQAR